MATLSGDLKGVNRTLIDTVGGTGGNKISLAENTGVVRRLYDSYTVPSADELGTSSFVLLMKIPKGATIVDGYVSMQAAGATGAGTIGYRASADGVEAADLDAFYTAAQFDPGGGAIDRLKMSSTVDGFNKKFEAEVQVVLDVTEITADSGGDTLELELYYVLD